MAAAQARGEFRARPSVEARRHRSSAAAIGVHARAGPRVLSPASARLRAPVPPVGVAATVGAFILLMLIVFAASALPVTGERCARKCGRRRRGQPY